jgi:hypothetical protein
MCPAIMASGTSLSTLKEDVHMAGNDAANKVFEAINEGSDAFIDIVRATNDRGHRFSTALIEEAQEGQRELAELAKRWMAAPFDFFGIYSSLIETTTKGQSRALDITRQWFGEMADAQKESRQYMQRMISANRTAGEAAADAARGLFSRATEAVQAATEGNGRRAVSQAQARAEAAASEL